MRQDLVVELLQADSALFDGLTFERTPGFEQLLCECSIGIRRYFFDRDSYPPIVATFPGNWFDLLPEPHCPALRSSRWCDCCLAPPGPGSGSTRQPVQPVHAGRRRHKMDAGVFSYCIAVGYNLLVRRSKAAKILNVGSWVARRRTGSSA